MFPKLRTWKAIALVALLSVLATYTRASEVGVFSFKPFRTCKMSPESPPKKLLNKTYKIYTGTGDWQIADINGDGRCDWIRGGYEGYRTDQEEPPMREFIYLGTSKGWREFAQSKAYMQARKTKTRAAVKGLMLPYVAAYNFNQPLLVYSSKDGPPYVVAVSRPDAPAPYPEAKNIDVMRWDATYDMLRFVGELERLQVITFIRDEICKNPQAHWNRGSPLFITDGLCKK